MDDGLRYDKKMRIKGGDELLPAKMRDIHVYLPRELIEKADKYVLRGLYSSKTEMVSDCMRRRIEELESGKRGMEPENANSPRAPIARDAYQEVDNER